MRKAACLRGVRTQSTLAERTDRGRTQTSLRSLRKLDCATAKHVYVAAPEPAPFAHPAESLHVTTPLGRHFRGLPALHNPAANLAISLQA